MKEVTLGVFILLFISQIALVHRATADDLGLDIDLLYSKQGEERSDESDDGVTINASFPLGDHLGLQLRHSTTQITSSPKLSDREIDLLDARGDRATEMASWTELVFTYFPDNWAEGWGLGVSYQRIDFDLINKGYDQFDEPLGYARNEQESGYGVHLIFQNRFSENYFYQVELAYVDVYMDDVLFEFQLGYQVTPRLAILGQIRDFDDLSISYHELGIRYRF
ncbi:MAG: hypothetical protein ACWA5K_06290 [bacterium]